MFYLSFAERSLITTSYEDTVRNYEPNYAMSKIIYDHYHFKQNELNKQKKYKKISAIEYMILNKRLQEQFMICSDCMERLLECRQDHYRDRFIDFERSIYKLDIIGRLKK